MVDISSSVFLYDRMIPWPKECVMVLGFLCQNIVEVINQMLFSEQYIYIYIYIYSWVFYNNIKRKSAQQCGASV